MPVDAVGGELDEAGLALDIALLHVTEPRTRTELPAGVAGEDAGQRCCCASVSHTIEEGLGARSLDRPSGSIVVLVKGGGGRGLDGGDDSLLFLLALHRVRLAHTRHG